MIIVNITVTEDMVNITDGSIHECLCIDVVKQFCYGG